MSLRRKLGFDSNAGRDEFRRLRPRAARKLAEAQRLLEEERAEAQRLRKFAEGLERALQAETERGTEVEERVAAASAKLEDVYRELESQKVAATTQAHQLEALQDELRQARKEAAAERSERQRIEQRLDTLLQSETDPRQAREQRLAESDLVHAEGVQNAEAAERALADARRELARVRPAPSEAPGGDRKTREQGRNAPPPERRGAARRSDFRSRRARFGHRWWWRRARAPCAVCHRPRPTKSDADLTASGWTLTAAGVLCPACQAEGWEFPAGARVPFRRVDAAFSR